MRLTALLLAVSLAVPMGARAQGGATPARSAEPPLPPPDSAALAATRPPPGPRSEQFGRDVRAGFVGTVHVATSPLRWSRQWLALPAGAAGLVVLSRLDEPVHRMLDRNHSPTVDHALTAIEPFGTTYTLGTVVVTYLTGLALDVPSLRRTGVEAATSSIIAAGIVTPGIKLLVGRSRPWADRGAYTFHPLSGQQSFPSGHTTQAFAAASVFAAEARPLPAKIAIYGLAAGVGCARMVHDAHFLTDVLAGATIGTVTGRAVVRWERAHPGSWAPYVGPEGVGVTRKF